MPIIFTLHNKSNFISILLQVIGCLFPICSKFSVVKSLKTGFYLKEQTDGDDPNAVCFKLQLRCTVNFFKNGCGWVAINLNNLYCLHNNQESSNSFAFDSRNLFCCINIACLELKDVQIRACLSAFLKHSLNIFFWKRNNSYNEKQNWIFGWLKSNLSRHHVE